ncbi:MAG: hypothetical protein AseanaTS_20610 [Candidatus Pelagadaptatus aseana]
MLFGKTQVKQSNIGGAYVGIPGWGWRNAGANGHIDDSQVNPGKLAIIRTAGLNQKWPPRRREKI